MKKEDILKRLQEIQMQYIGRFDISIETRADKCCTGFTITDYPTSRKLYIHHLLWDVDNTAEFEKIENEIKLFTNENN
jgi:hypothetical protein